MQRRAGLPQGAGVGGGGAARGGRPQEGAGACVSLLDRWADRPRPTPLKRTYIEPTLKPNPPHTITTQANAKALYRRGVARSHLGLLDEAKADLLAAAKAEPNNKDVRRELQVGY